MLTMLGTLVSGTFILGVKAVSIVGTGFLLSIGFFAGSVASVKAMTALSKQKEKDLPKINQESPVPGVHNN